MSAGARYEDGLPGPAVAGLFGQAAEAARRSGFLAVTGATLPECTCPQDCERDHANE
jgi:hypothetical protein